MDTTGQSVAEHLAQVTPALRRRDAERLIALMREITGREPEMWSAGIVGFGTCRYTHASGISGLSPILAFSPRKTSSTLYVLDDNTPDALLTDLGPHTRGASCLYIKDLEKVDAEALRRIVSDTYERVLAGGDGRTAYEVLDEA